MIAASNRLICVSGPDLTNTGQGGTTFGGEFAAPAASVAAGMERVAGYLIEGAWAYRQGQPESGGPVLPEDRRQSAGGVSIGVEALTGGRQDRGIDSVSIGRTSRPGWPPVRVSPAIPAAAEVALEIGTPGDLTGCVVYMDPPYAGTTGYTADLSRAEVVAHALDFASLGATVAISEAEAIPELIAAGWYSTEITAGRVGQKRTFSKQQREFLTMNKTPSHTVAEQRGLFT